MIKNVKSVIIKALKSTFYQYFVFTKNTPTICLILHQFNFYVLLICEKKLVTRSFVTMGTNLPSCFLSLNFKTTPEVFTKLYFVEIS